MRIRGEFAREFKFKRSSDRIRTFILEGVSQSDSRIFWAGVHKRKALEKTRPDQQALHEDLLAKVLASAVRHIRADSINIILDRRTERWFLSSELDSLIERTVMLSHSCVFPPRLLISRFDSRRNMCLQVNDFIVGSVFQMVERSRADYYRLIDKMVVEGTLEK
jgi:hypothetical protein